MTMYFVKTPKANQLLKACHSLAILTVVLAISSSSGGNCSTTTTTIKMTDKNQNSQAQDERALDTHRHDHHNHRDHLHGTTAASSLVKAVGGDGRQQQPVAAQLANNFNDNLNNINLINYDNDDTKAGAKSLEGEKKSRELIEQPQQQDQKTGASNDEKGQPNKQPTSGLETLHKLMSEKDLRRTFQVETHDQVPEYQVLKLTVSRDGSHLISPISDLGELLITTTTNTNQRHGTQDSGHKGLGGELGNIETSALEAEEEAHSREQDGSDAQDQFSGPRQARGKRSTATASNERPGQRQANNNSEDERLIVMNLNTFGQDFSLRLKRNADFQQRIKDMKMFLAESTGDGRLRYTEIKQPNGQHHQHRKQEPHKRAADSAADSLEDSHKQVTSGKSNANSTTAGGAADGALKKNNSGQQSTPTDWHNIGSTYHDEENLAALLIERDRRTGQIQVDGTIGNDFVIKPMPRATIKALLAAKDEDGATNLASISHNTIKTAAASLISGNELKQAASHMHDEDPHDDDEMFLDEDEALELANLNGTSVGRAQTNSTSASLPQHQPQQRVLSKATSERKWRKHRKLMAQIQVPKPGQSQEAARARRHTTAQRHVNSKDTQTTNSSPEHFHMSHHIVYRQKPSSESSSSEHKHSFMFAPGQQNMEELARSFNSGGGGSLGQQKSVNGDNMIEESGAASRLYLARDGLRSEVGTDHAHDPLGGQFYLEPGSVTGFERAGFSDWSLVSPSGRHRAFPPYAFNSTNATLALERAWPSDRLERNSTANHKQQHARFKRHLSNGQRQPRLSGASSQHRPAHTSAAGSAPRGRRQKRQAPDVVWPEVLLVVDYDSFLLHGGDSREVKRYFVSFWNGVDLRYKLLVNPHIRISLAGMIVAKDRDATPYLERNRLRAPNADAVDAAGALTDMGKYLYREDRLPTYDLAVVITKLDMCRRRYEGGRCNRGTAGFAYVGGACVVNKRLEKVNSVAIIEDSGGFSGIIVAAHEVGHLLGCVHDGSPPPSYLGGPGATHCPWEDGFIMSDLRHTERGFRWSQCSVEQFKHFLNGETATCLYNYPHESQMLHRLLPGSMLSLDDQCKRDRGTNACFKDARVCAQLFCFDSASGYCVSYRPAAEGSPCGDGHVCRNGKCVGEIENIIPDYTHQSQTVVAPTGQRQRALATGQPIPAAAATASVGSALVPSRLTPSSQDGLSASSSSTSSAATLDNGTSSKLVASTAATSAPAKSERRMDTFQVDTPLQQLPINYYNQRQASSQAPFQHNSNLNHNNQQQQQQQQRQQNAAMMRHKTTTSSLQRGGELVGFDRQRDMAQTYSDPYAYSPKRKLTTTTTTSGHLTRSSEPLFAAGSAISAASPTSSATRRVVQQRSSVNFAVAPIQRQQFARTTRNFD